MSKHPKYFLNSKKLLRKIKENLGKKKIKNPGFFAKKRKKNIVTAKHYKEVHSWVAREFGKADCCDINKDHFTTNHYEWANISGCYLHKRSDWIRLCKSCHFFLDWFNFSVGDLINREKRKLQIITSL